MTLSILTQHLVALLLLVAAPIWDRVETRKLKQSTDPRARVHSYRRTVGALWLVTIVLLLAVPLPTLFNAPPLTGAVAAFAARVHKAWPLLVGLLIGIALPVIMARTSAQAAERFAKPLQSLHWFLPRTPLERRWFVAVCFSAGICEEVIYRGFLLRYLTTLPLGLSLPASAVVAAVMFALAHMYQGWVGALAVTALALLLTAIFFATGSLWLPILVHVLIDLRVLLLWKGRAESTPA